MTYHRPLHRRPLAAQEEFGTAPSSPLDQRPCPVPPRHGVSSAPLCGINAGAVPLTGARRASPLPSPRAPIKRSPRAPPSPHRSLPLRWSSEQLSEPSSFLTKPRMQSTPSPPQPLTQRPPAAIPAAELRHLPAGSPLPTPSSQIKPTPRIASPCPC
jgi:hypothetical protein